MQWRDEAIVLGGRKLGEGGLILDVLTREHGRKSAFVYGGASRKKKAQFEPGNTVSVTFTARTDDQLGRFDAAEVSRERATRLLDDAGALAAIGAITAILCGALNENDAATSAVFDATEVLLDQLGQKEIWPALYVRWELGLLARLGYGLDLAACAISGANDGLTHVSPKTGRAVRGSEAEDYVDRLFRLPAFLIDVSAGVTREDIHDGLALTGHFLEARLFAAVNSALPPERARLIDRLTRQS
jgi:DNA repair protein RecO (recombination protein O)